MKYQRFIPSGCRDIEIRKFEVVAKTQFLYVIWGRNVPIPFEHSLPSFLRLTSEDKINSV